jgi:limonene-1,2-epoxide hydrolase
MTETRATDPEAVVRAFCKAFERLDVEALLGYFHPDAVYHNIPLDPVVGIDGIRSLITMFTAGVESIEFRIRHLAVSGDVVLTERVDVFVQPTHSIELPVMGTFEIRDGRIAAWRDYFDLNQYMQQAAPATA